MEGISGKTKFGTRKTKIKEEIKIADYITCNLR